MATDKIIPREKLLKNKGFEFKDMLKKEAHHADEIVLGEDGKYYWKENPITRALVSKISFGKVWEMMDLMGYGRNSEHVRRLVREYGYSLMGYW